MASKAMRRVARSGAALSVAAAFAGAASWLVGGCSGWDPTSPFERNSPEVERAVIALDAGEYRAAEEILEKYLGTGECGDGGIELPDTIKRKADGSFDLGLTLFGLAESFGEPFGDEEEAPEGNAPDRDARLRAMQARCARMIVDAIAQDPSQPIELRARAFYLAGNLEFLQGRYMDAIEQYDEALRLVPGLLLEAGGDDVGRDAAWNRAIALRRLNPMQVELEEQQSPQPDAGPDGSQAPDAGDQDGGEPQDAGDEGQRPDPNDAGDAGNDASDDSGIPASGLPDASGDAGDDEGDAGPDGGQAPPPASAEPRPAEPDPKADDRILDQLEEAPTYQEQEAKNRGQRRQRGPRMEDK